jgi:cell division control protein 45
MTESEIRSLAQMEKQLDEDEEEEEEEEEEDIGDEEDDNHMDEDDFGEGTRRRRQRRKESVGVVAASAQSTHGFTAAGLLYAMALQVGINRKDLLWYSILGLTDQYVHQRIGAPRYRGDLRFFAEKVRNFETSTSSSSSTDDFNAHNITLSPQEYVFMLYRHWNLYDSMYHTRSIAVKLGVWGHQGRKNLEQWLARMGLPLEECKQKFVAMKKKIKDRLPSQLEKYAPEFNVSDLYVESFIKRPSFDKEISAFDVIYGASALLESVKQQHMHGTETDMELDSEEDFLKVNFWNAYRSLSHSNNILDEGIDEAIDLQCAIVRQVSLLIQTKDVLQMGRYRIAFIKDTPDLKYFTHPMALSKLAHFLVDTLIDLGRATKCKPLILCAMHGDHVLMVGVEGQHSGSSHVPKYAQNLLYISLHITNYILT